jgi:hypothetical protein
MAVWAFLVQPNAPYIMALLYGEGRNMIAPKVT